MADPAYTTAAEIDELAGTLAVDLRTDDGTEADLVAEAINYASGRIDFYCARYAQAELAVNQWVKGVATFIALRWLCMRRLNDLPKSIEAEWQERKAELQMILDRTAEVPRAARSRRPVTVTNHHVDLQKRNNQVRVDRARSTGVADGYVRPTDDTAPDQR